jgi:hypothetical protein
MTTQDPPPNGIDISRPNVARIYDYLLGGKDNFTVDREAGIEGFFDGFDLIEPGVVWINEWRPGPDFRSAGQPRSLRGGVGRRL